MTTEQAIKEIQKLERKLRIVTAALNYIDILIEDEFTEIKQVVQDTLREI